MNYFKKLKSDFKQVNDSLIFVNRPILNCYIKLLIILPYPISFFIDNLVFGWKRSIYAFHIWKFIMTNDYSVVSIKTFGFSLIEDLYKTMDMMKWSK